MMCSKAANRGVCIPRAMDVAEAMGLENDQGGTK